MADTGINSPNSTSSGPPPTGGGSFDIGQRPPIPIIPQPKSSGKEDRSKLLARWKPEVVSAATEVNFGLAIEDAALSVEPYRSLAILQQRQRRYLEQLTIARKLYVIKNGNWPPSVHALKDFFSSNIAELRSLWQATFEENRETGIPRLFRDSYTISETRDWLADRGLFGLKPERFSQTPLRSDRPQGGGAAVAEKGSTTDAKTAAGGKGVAATVAPGAPSEPKKYIHPEPKPAGVDLDDYDQEEEIKSTVAESGEGDVNVYKHITPGTSTIKTPGGIGGGATTGGVGLSVSVASGVSTAPATGESQQVVEEDSDYLTPGIVPNKSDAVGKVSVPESVRLSAKSSETIKDDSLSPGFAKGEGLGGEQEKITGKAAAKLKVASSGIAGHGAQADTTNRRGIKGKLSAEVTSAETTKATEESAKQESNFGSETRVRRGKKAKVEATDEVDEQEIQAPVLDEVKEIEESPAGIQQSTQKQVSSSIEEPYQTEKSPEKDSSRLNLDVKVTEKVTKTQSTKVPAFGDSFIAPQNIKKSKKGKGDGRVIDETAKKFLSQEESDEAAEQKKPSDGQAESNFGEEQGSGEPTAEELKNQDYLPPQFGPGEYQTPEQEEQVAAQKAAGKRKDQEKEARLEGSKEPDSEDEDEEEEEPEMGPGQALDRFNALTAQDKLSHINDWLTKQGSKKKRLPSLSSWKMKLLEAASLKYPELRELLEKVKVEAYKASHGVFDDKGPGQDDKRSSMQEDFMYWAKRIGAEYVIKWYVFPYASVSAFWDAGIEAVIAFIILNIYWIISAFTPSPYFRGLVRWQKYLIAVVDIVIATIIVIAALVAVVSTCQAYALGAKVGAAINTVVSVPPEFTFCNDVNNAVKNIGNSAVGQSIGTPGSQGGGAGGTWNGTPTPVSGKTVLLIGDSLVGQGTNIPGVTTFASGNAQIKIPLSDLIKSAGGTFYFYGVGGSNLQEWGEGASHQCPSCGRNVDTKIEPLLAVAKPDIVIVLLGTNSVNFNSNDQAQYVREINGKLGGKTSFWLGVPDFKSCPSGGTSAYTTKVKSDALNTIIKSNFSGGFLDTSNEIPSLFKDGNACTDIHQDNASLWANTTYNKFFKAQ